MKQILPKCLSGIDRRDGTNNWSKYEMSWTWWNNLTDWGTLNSNTWKVIFTSFLKLLWRRNVRLKQLTRCTCIDCSFYMLQTYHFMFFAWKLFEILTGIGDDRIGRSMNGRILQHWRNIYRTFVFAILKWRKFIEIRIRV